MYELLSTLIFALLVVRTIWITVEKLLRVKLQEEQTKGNVAVMLFAGVYAFCLQWQASDAVDPAANALRTMVQARDVLTPNMLGIALGYSVGLFLVAFAIGYFVLAITVRVCMAVTKDVDEIEQLRGGNIGTAVYLTITLLAMTVMTRPALSSVLDGLINYQYLREIGEGATPRVDGNAPITPETVE